MSNALRKHYREDISLVFGEPIDRDNANALDNTTDGATCTAHVFETAVDGIVTVASGVSTTMAASNHASLVADDVIEIDQADQSRHVATVTGVASGVITFTPILTAAIVIGARVRKRLGAVVTMTEFGTPNIDKQQDWGFRGNMNGRDTWRLFGLKVEAEMRFVGDPAGTLDGYKILAIELVADAEVNAT